MKTINHLYYPYYYFEFLDKTINCSFFLKHSCERDEVKDLYNKKLDINYLIFIKKPVLKTIKINKLINENKNIKNIHFFDEQIIKIS